MVFFRGISMHTTRQFAVAFGLAAVAVLAGLSEAAAQDKGKTPPTSEPAVELGTLLCQDVMRLSGEDRSIALGVLHGYFLGKKGSTSYVSSTARRATDDFVEYCLEHPSEGALQAFAKFAK